MIYVCNLFEMPGHVEALGASHLISLVPAEEQPPTPAGLDPDRHLRIEIHDISEPVEGCVPCEDSHIRTLLEFVSDWDGERPLVVHCVAGISRSMAAAMITLVARGGCTAEEAALAVRAAAPHAQPNRLMIALADELLGCKGRLIAARAAMTPATTSLVHGPLVELALTRNLAGNGIRVA
jgi:predicted protein tyrosine phosphatase